MTTQDRDSDELPRPVEPQPDAIPRVRSPDMNQVAIGLIILGSIYFLPLFPAPAPATGSFTLADIVMGGYANLFPWSPMLIITFVIGWLVSLTFIVSGLLNTKPDLSFEKL